MLREKFEQKRAEAHNLFDVLMEPRIERYKSLKANSAGAADILKAIIGMVVGLVVFAALIDTVLINLNTAATNTTLKANTSWTNALNLLYVVGLMAVIVGIGIAAYFLYDALRE